MFSKTYSLRRDINDGKKNKEEGGGGHKKLLDDLLKPRGWK